MSETLRDEDVTQIIEHGLSVDEVRRQLRLLADPPPRPVLDRPCTVGDGIRRFGEGGLDGLLAAHAAAAAAGRMMKVVPASGAATRMFQSLLAVRAQAAALTREDIASRAGRGERAAEDVLALLAQLPACPFFEALRAALAADGLDLDALLSSGRVGDVLDYLVGPRGLDYAALPKALLAFHRYPSGSRTAFEEHLVEAAATIRDAGGRCRLHFTVSPEHETRFRALLERVRPAYEQHYAARFEVSFSTQKASTDTVGMDLERRLFRAAGGRVLFRPGGHGALIENLNDLRGDIIYVKTVDNLQPDRAKDATVRWKRVLGGLLVVVQEQIWQHVRRLRAEHTDEVAAAALHFARAELDLEVAAVSGSAALRAELLRQLDRPVRVCGVVRNTGEPGGGPFWVRAAGGTCSRQIVEQAEVDPDAADQQAALRASTHFNPVDLVCGVRDDHGEPFDLLRFVDEQAVFITRKSNDGRTLDALERPGLWNGGMARWITLFVEVPITTFSPVKTVMDLLRPEHRTEEERPG